MSETSDTHRANLSPAWYAGASAGRTRVARPVRIRSGEARPPRRPSRRRSAPGGSPPTPGGRALYAVTARTGPASPLPTARRDTALASAPEVRSYACIDTTPQGPRSARALPRHPRRRTGAARLGRRTATGTAHGGHGTGQRATIRPGQRGAGPTIRAAGVADPDPGRCPAPEAADHRTGRAREHVCAEIPDPGPQRWRPAGGDHRPSGATAGFVADLDHRRWAAQPTRRGNRDGGHLEPAGARPEHHHAPNRDHRAARPVPDRARLCLRHRRRAPVRLRDSDLAARVGTGGG